MPRLVATNLSRYASRDLKPGEEFEASESDAFVLKRAGKAVDAGSAAKSGADGESQPDTPEQGGSELFAGNLQQRRGRYNRRDMRAKN